MSNYLIRQGQKWSVKVAIPADVQHVFEKRAFKQSLKTSNKTVAISRSAPLIAEFKDEIEKARGNPAKHLEEYLTDVQAHLRTARGNSDTEPDTISGIEAEVLDRLVQANGAQQPEDLSEEDEERVLATYKIVTGQVTSFAGPLEDYLKSRKVEPRTLAKERLAVTEFVETCTTIQKVNRKAVKNYVRKLSGERGLKNKTIRDRLSFLGVYWKWLAYQDYVPENAPNPFAGIELPKENRKDRAEEKRLAFTQRDIRKLHTAINANGSEALKSAFLIAIYTGCRIEEIASLTVTDVSDDVISIRRSKTEAGNRDIPIHDAIKPLMEELRAGGGNFLFPELTEDKYGGRSGVIGHEFTKIKTDLKFDRRYVFHSLRKTVATLMEQAGVPEGVAADILGHLKKTLSYGVYSGGSSMEQKSEAVLKLDYGLS